MENMEDIINGIFYSQLVLFSAFGVVPLRGHTSTAATPLSGRTPRTRTRSSSCSRRRLLLLYYFTEYVSRPRWPDCIFAEIPAWKHTLHRTGGNHAGNHMGDHSA
jgi:hypothetical protein